VYTIKEILQIEVAPALGCTEPAAVALCAAAAGALLEKKQLDAMQLWLSPNIYKNAFAVAIPGTQGAVGIDLAAALGFFCGDPKRKLEVLELVDSEALNKARKLIDSDNVYIDLLPDKTDIYIRCKLTTGDETAEAVIERTHDNLASLSYNGKDIAEHPLLRGASEAQCDVRKLENFLRTSTLKNLTTLIDDMDEQDFEFVKRGVEYNLALAQHGLTMGGGLAVGKTLEKLVQEGLIKRDMILDARILTSAAADARMAGVKLPAMSSAGSGNHGLTAVLPIWAVKDYLDVPSEKKVWKAVALSHLVTAYVKSHTGRLSAVCGCSIAAGAGATAGIAYLMKGNREHIAGAIKNLISDLAGVICDGAKAACALKLATAAGTAVQAALFSLHGINVSDSDGIITGTPEQTTRNVGRISTEGMIETDRTILQIMIEKQFSQ